MKMFKLSYRQIYFPTFYVARSVTFFLTKDLADHELSVLFNRCL